MLVKIYAKGLELSHPLKDNIEAKIRLSLGVFINKIRRIDVYISDENGPKGGEDMLCKIKVTTEGHGQFVVQEKGLNLKETINVCVHRVKRSANRRFERAHERRPPPQSYLIMSD